MLDAPVPVSATISTLFSTVTITFNHPLVPGLIDRFNWFGVSDWILPFSSFIATDPPLIVGNTVSFRALRGLPIGGPNRISYAPPPFDVVSDFGFVDAPAFADFPLTVVP